MHADTLLALAVDGSVPAPRTGWGLDDALVQVAWGRSRQRVDRSRRR